MAGNLEGRIAIVTGAGSGIGRANSWLMAERGASIVVQDINPDGAEETAQGVRDRGGRVMVAISDIGDAKSAARVVERTEAEWGRLDILVNNAGIGVDRPIEEIDEKGFDRMFAVHVKGSFFCAKAAVPGMKRRRYGRIVNTSSRWAMAGHTTASDYIGAKSALLGLTKAWAKELAPWSITVNAIAPGGVKTQMVLDTIGEEGIKAEAALVPLLRWADPVEMAYTVAFLASDEAAFITGQCISPNGGKTMVGF